MNLIKRNGGRWDPFSTMMDDLHHEVDRAFNRSMLIFPRWDKAFEPDIDIVDEKDHFLVKADIPGLKKEEIDIKVEGRFLTLKGERKQEKEKKEKNYYSCERFYGAFTRQLELPAEVKTEQVKAAYKDGVLEITLPKSEAEKAKQISVEIK